MAIIIFSSGVGAVLGGKYYPREKVSQQAPVSVNYSVPAYSNVNTNPVQEIHTITGTVESIKGNTFTLREVSREILGNTASTRTIIVGSDTKIQKGAVGDEGLFSTQLIAYMKNIEDTKKNPVLSLPPELINYADARPEDIKIDDEVLVTTIESVGSQSQLFANKVQIQPELKRLPPPKR